MQKWVWRPSLFKPLLWVRTNGAPLGPARLLRRDTLWPVELPAPHGSVCQGPALVNCPPCCSGPRLMWLFSSHFCSCEVICHPHGQELPAWQLWNSQICHREWRGDLCFFKDHCFLSAFERCSGSNKTCDLLGTVILPPCSLVIEETLIVTGLESCQSPIHSRSLEFCAYRILTYAK